MNDRTFKPSRSEPPVSEHGLRSLRGIRWLLVAGAAVSAVSVYRLVESQWAGMSVVGQFLTLVLGALALAGTGEVLEQRLRLPQAGRALRFLFTGLVPVLSWGAAYLGLMNSPLGWAVFILTMGVLLTATTRVFRTTLGYQGIVYPWVFGALTLSLPLLPYARGVAQTSFDTFYVSATVVFGTMFYIGSRHINRFLFHRDRRDGIDRPVHFLPFLVLAVLYVAAMALLEPRSPFVALPLSVLGLSLVRTGEEYYRALVQASRATPALWPKRSVALLSLGISLMVIAGPLSVMDSTLRCTTLVSALTAFVLLGWAVHYRSVVAHITGLGTALVAYHLSPSLSPELAQSFVHRLSHWSGISTHSVVMTSLAHLGFQVGLVFGARALRRRGTAETIVRTHSILTAFHLSALVVLSLLDVRASMLFFITALAITALGLVLGRRIEHLVAGHWVTSAAVVATSVNLSGPPIVFEEALRAVGIFNLALVVASPGFEGALASFLRVSSLTVRRALLIPTSLWGLAIGACGLITNWIEPVLAGAILLASGHRLRSRWLFALGVGASSFGIHRFVFSTYGSPSAYLTITTLAMVVLSWLALRWTWSHTGEAPVWQLGATLSFFGHLMLAAAWFLMALEQSKVALEPIIVLLAGAALADWGLRNHKKVEVTLGLGALVFYPSLHLLACEWIETFPLFMLVAAAPLTLLLLTKDRFTPEIAEMVSQPIAGIVSIWSSISIAACLIYSGVASLALIAIVITVVMLETKKVGELPLISFFLATIHMVLVAKGVRGGYLVIELFELGPTLLPVVAAVGLPWLLLVDRFGKKHIWTRSLAVGLECTTVWGYLIANFSSATFSSLENIVLAAVAVGFAARHGFRSWQDSTAHRAWMMQTWMALTVLHGFTAGWLSFGHGIAPYALLAGAFAETAFAAFVDRYRLGVVLSGPSFVTGQLLAFSAGSLALHRTVLGSPEATVWFRVLPLFLVSLFYMVISSRASRDTERIVSALMSSGFLGGGLAALGWAQGVGSEFYCLAPGVSLVALSYLLREEMGPSWSRHIFTAGAAFVYATPVLALHDNLTWTWQAILLVITVAFGTASFVLRSRSLLTVSTAAMLIDLTCFVIMIRETEPLLLWVAGLGFGMALIGLAAYLEYQREGLAQQIRVFGTQLQCWH